MKSLSTYIQESFENWGTDAQWEYGLGRQKDKEPFEVELQVEEDINSRSVEGDILNAKNELFSKFSKKAAAEYYKIDIDVANTGKIVLSMLRSVDVNSTWPTEKVFPNPFYDYSDMQCEKALKNYLKRLAPVLEECGHEDTLKVVAKIYKYINNK